MRLNVCTLYTRQRPSACARRVYLRLHGVQPAEPGPYDLALRDLGIRHEQAHLVTLPGCIDLSEGSMDERIERTAQELARHVAPLYQPVLMADVPDAGPNGQLLGIPDFLIPTDSGWIVRDTKLSLHADEDRHPEIPAQLQAFGLLLHLVTGTPLLGGSDR